MQPLRIRITAFDGSSEIAAQLFSVLERESWCSASLHEDSLDDLVQRDLEPGSLILIVSRDPFLLSRAISRLQPHQLDVQYAFVNLFRESRSCLDLLTAGFDNFLTYPFQPGDVIARLRSMSAARRVPVTRSSEHLATNLALEVGLHDLIGTSPPFRRILHEVRILAKVDATVLITGETGTGKDMCARAIHYSSPRSHQPFIPINCGAIPDELFENELFGHERGAFTDARKKQVGLVELANGGTLFLDEIESLSMSGQIRLLRFLQGNEYTPLGSGRPVKADVRIIAATNADLLQMVKEKMFREDVYFRLEVLTLCLPPLRERPRDVGALADHVTSRYCLVYGKPKMSLSSAAVEKLESYEWPGNVRELENVIHRTVVHVSSDVISDSDISLDGSQLGISRLGEDLMLPFDEARRRILSRFEQEYMTSLLRRFGGNLSKAAKQAGKHRRTLWEIMRRHNLSRSNF